MTTKLLTAALVAVSVGLYPALAGAQAPAPAIPALIRIIVPFGAGASTDVFARAVAPQLAVRLKTNVIVENRAGGSSMIGSEAVAKGPKDGSMLLLTTPSTVTAAATMRSVSFDLNNDLVPLSILSQGPMVVGVSSQSAIRTPADLVAAARAKPDGITYGTSGIGTLAHLGTELINESAKIQLKHIPYKGASFGLIDLLGGNIDLMLAANTTFAPQIKSGCLRIIAVTSLNPSPAFPNLPAMSSVAPGFSTEIWNAVFAPAGIPAALAQKLNQELNEISASKELQDIMVPEGASAPRLSLDQLKPKIRDSYQTWKKLATDKKILLE